MPIYEYSCPRCNLKFELLSPVSKSRDTAPCPQCHTEARRIFSTFACPSKDSTDSLSSASGASSCSTCSAASCATCGM